MLDIGSGAAFYGASLTLDPAGNLIGASDSATQGLIFEIAKTDTGYAGTPTILAAFNGTNGADPNPVVVDAAGNLIGTTYLGGADNDGTVFEIAKTASGYSNTITTLATFTGSNGKAPAASLIFDASGNLYGVTNQGGTFNDGTIYELAKVSGGYATAPAVLTSFNNPTDPSSVVPRTPFIDAAGNLVGLTGAGGANDWGSIFEATNTGSGYESSPATLFSFSFQGVLGAVPNGPFIADSAGNLFATAGNGGGYDDGLIFEVAKTPSGYANTPTIVVSFNGIDGGVPFSNLIMDAAGDLFGTTGFNGLYNDGTVFELVKTAAGYSNSPITLATFTGANGKNPESALVADAFGDLFSSTSGGGAQGSGTIFELQGIPFRTTNAPFATPSGSVPAPTAIADFYDGVTTAPVSITDDVSLISANLDSLQSMAAAGKLGSLTISNGGTPYIELTSAQLGYDASVFQHVTVPYALTINEFLSDGSISGLTPADVLTFDLPAKDFQISGAGPGHTFTVTGPSYESYFSDFENVANIEFVQFSDQMNVVATPAEAQVALLYQAALGRLPDPLGLVGWQQAFATEPTSARTADSFTALAETPVNGLPDLAYGFTQSAEFQQKYGTLTDAQFVTQLYANMLDRTPDTAGLDGWVNALAQGHSREWVLVGFAESQEAYNNAEVGYIGQTGTVHTPWLVLA